MNASSSSLPKGGTEEGRSGPFPCPVDEDAAPFPEDDDAVPGGPGGGGIFLPLAGGGGGGMDVRVGTLMHSSL